MLNIQTRAHLFAAAFVITLISVCAVLIHVQVNYDPQLRDVVRGPAVMVTAILAFPLSIFPLQQLRKNHLLSSELQRLVNRDRLTDVATRDFFFERLEMDPTAYGVSLMIDIDHFKLVNDTHGHLAGDNVIHAVAQIMRAEIRDTDVVCRFGGEEFVVFLHSATPQEGWQIAERIRASTEAATTPTASGEIKVTVSVGGSMKDRIEHIDAAIKRADDCLYRAKAGGRNQIIVDWPGDVIETTARAS